MDVGFNGGGVAVGNPTPDIDAVASRADFNFGVFSTEFFPNPRHDSYRTILHPPRHSDAANVRATGRSARVNHSAAVAARSGLRHQAIGKWHMGKTKSRSRRTLALMISAALTRYPICIPNGDVHVNPEVALSPDRSEYIQNCRSAKMTFMCAAVNRKPLPTLRRNIWKTGSTLDGIWR
ncbi:hypothetical protein BANRA_00031 [Escherichia coli]|nr:hypothetical protein BANRA_00031 [Escherichia coli]